MENNTYMDVKILSKYLHVSESLIYHMVSKNEIPFIKVGSRIIFDRAEIDKWMHNHCMIVEELPHLTKI